MRKITNKNVLITGGAGFIGSHLIDELLKEKVKKIVIVDNFFVGKMENISTALEHSNVVLYKENAADFNAMKEIIKKEEIDIVYNMATMALIYSFFNPNTAYSVNVDIANVLVSLLKDKFYSTLIHMSSSEAYGSAQYVPMDENHPLNPTTPYAAGKAAADLLIKSFYNLYDLDVVIIRPFNNYGPRQNDKNLAGIIPLTSKRINDGEEPVIEGDGLQTRDYIFVKDTIKGLIKAYETEGIKGELINLGSGKEITIKEIVQTICDYYNYTGKIKTSPKRLADVKRHCASSEKAKKLLNFKPVVSFKEGIKITLDWYRKEQ